MARISLFKENCIASILELFVMEDCFTAPTPGRHAALKKLDADEKMESRAHRPYQELVGCLLELYLSSCTRPHIAHVIELSRHIVRSGEMHL